MDDDGLDPALLARGSCLIGCLLVALGIVALPVAYAVAITYMDNPSAYPPFGPAIEILFGSGLLAFLFAGAFWLRSKARPKQDR